ncbi:MAG: c-type cytochrome, partial [Terriglobia bacterium]
APATPAPAQAQPAMEPAPAQSQPPAAPQPAAAPAVDTAALRALGEQVYGAQCNRCHGVDGMGTPDLYPPLKGSKTVADADFTQQIRNILNGLVAEPIDGKTYFGAMPAMAGILSDEEIAAVIYFERTSWGNQATAFPTAADVKRVRDEQ